VIVDMIPLIDNKTSSPAAKLGRGSWKPPTIKCKPQQVAKYKYKRLTYC
jgi:hypothetical protein